MKLDDLDPGTMYRLKLNDFILHVKTSSPSIKPPTNIAVSEIDGEMEVSWDPPDNVSKIESYLIRANNRLIGEVKDPHANCTVIDKVNGRLTLQSKGMIKQIGSFHYGDEIKHQTVDYPPKANS